MGSNANGANDFIPNSFQTPNILVDRLMPLLLDAELRCVIFAFRQIYGWEDARPARSEVLSISDFEHGTRGSAGVGLGRTAIINALHGLAEYRVMVKVGEPTREGQRWSFGSSAQIDWAGLLVRAEARKAKRRGQTTKARKTPRDKGTGQLDRPVERSVGLTGGESVGQTSERSVEQTSPPYIEKLKEKPNAETNHAAAKTRESIGGPPDNAAAGKGVVKKVLDDLGLAKSQRDQVLALEAPVALALIWDAQARGRVPAALLRTMVAQGDAPPMTLRELAEFAIREGVHVKAEAEQLYAKSEYKRDAEKWSYGEAETDDEAALRLAQLKELAQEADARFAERKAALAEAGDEAQSDTVAVLPTAKKRPERPSEKAMRFWLEWWPETAAALKTADCPDFLVEIIKDARPNALEDGTVTLRAGAMAQRFSGVLEPVRKRLEDEMKVKEAV